MLYALVCERSIRPRFDEVRQEFRDLGLDEAMWQVIESSWKQNPKERWNAGLLSQRLQDILISRSPTPQRRIAGNLVSPPLAQTRSAGASFLPSQPRDFLRPPSPSRRPLPLSFASDPAVMPHQLVHPQHGGETTVLTSFDTEASDEDGPSHPYVVSPPFDFNVTSVESSATLQNAQAFTSDYLSSTTSTPDRSPLLTPLKPSTREDVTVTIVPQYHLPNIPTTRAGSPPKPLAQSSGPHPSNSLPAVFSTIVDAIRDKQDSMKPYPPDSGSLGLFTGIHPSVSTATAGFSPELQRRAESRAPIFPVPTPASLGPSGRQFTTPPVATPTLTERDPRKVEQGMDYFSHRQVSNHVEPQPLIDVTHAAPTSRTLSLPEDDIVLPFPGREEKLHPDLHGLTLDSLVPSKNAPSAQSSIQQTLLSPLSPLDAQMSRLSMQENSFIPREPILRATQPDPEAYFIDLNSPPLETPSLASSTPSGWETSTTPSSPETLSPDVEHPEDLPDLDSHKPMHAVAMKRRSLSDQSQYAVQSSSAQDTFSLR